ncbi:MAG: helix-turn-helix domain-containing protein [Saprospiraceae bacterium]|nr:helix-turn-helix domain-containing protein [Saprospiraceae bacterium]
MDWQELTDKQIIDILALRFKDYRIRKHYTQKELAIKVVCLNSIQKIEQGEWASMRVLLPALRALKLTENLEMLIPDVSFSPIQLFTKARSKNNVKKPMK